MADGSERKAGKFLRFLKTIFILAIIAALAFAVLKYAEEIVDFKRRVYSTVENLRGQDAEETPQEPDLSGVTPFARTGSEWYDRCTLIYHACGGIDGLSYTNSKEALLKTLEAGARFIEIDFSVTRDGRLVCLHEWEDLGEKEPLSYDEFMKSKIFGKYTPMSAEDFLACMAEYPEAMAILDTKDDLAEVVEMLKALRPRRELMDRMIVQVYGPGEKEQIRQIYPFPEDNYLLTIYKLDDQWLENVVDICVKDNISVITMPRNQYPDDQIQLLREKNFTLYEHTVNRPDQAAAALDRGIHGLYTDFLQPEDLY